MKMRVTLLRISRALVDRVLKRLLMAVPSRSAQRRALAAVCAAAFLVVSLAHAVQHFDAPFPVIALQADAGSADDPSDSSSKVAVAVDHCHGCAMTAIPVLGRSIIPILRVADHPPAKVENRRPHPPIAETPPPIVAI
jgi:hypothetical protein